MTFPERYTRQIHLQGFGAGGQKKLQKAKVLVVGAGGLGVPALQYLAAMGVGTIGIVDGDAVSLTNLNRQILYGESEVGMAKASLAAKKLLQQNPSITVKTFETFLTVDNAIETIAQFDVVIDGTDNFSARYIINDACVMLGKPFVYGAIQQFEGHLSVFNHNGGPTYRCLYPHFPSAGEIPDCNTAGVLGVVPGIIGCQQALEAVKLITGVGKPASGYLQIFDFLNNDQYEVRLKARPEHKLIVKLRESYDDTACSNIATLQPKELYKWFGSNRKFVLIDVRERDEFEQAHLEKALLKPLSTLNTDITAIPPGTAVVTLCQKGGRSAKAASILKEANSELEVYSLEGGMEGWQKELGTKLIVT